MAIKAKKDKQEHKVFKARPGQLEHKAVKAKRVKLVHKVFKVILVQLELKAILEIKVRKVEMAQQVLQDHKVPKV